MKIKQISKHIWSIREWMLIPIHVWLVVDKNGVTLVDAGIPKMAKGILKYIENLDAGPLQQILLTHGHADHVGSINSVVSTNKVPIYAHEIEIPYMEGLLHYPRRKKAEKNVETNLVAPLPMDTDGSLIKVAGLQPYLTPGHSPGHVVYYHEADDVLLAGDLFTSKNGKLSSPMPMFTGDMREAVHSSKIVEQLKPARLEVCHGNSISNPAEQLKVYIHKMENKLKKSIQ